MGSRRAESKFNLLAAPDDLGKATELGDMAVAASFSNLRLPQERFAFREGGWDDQSLFYPAPGCTAPPGFSLEVVPPLPTALAGAGGCESYDLARAANLPPLDAEGAKGLACRGFNSAPVRRPTEEPPNQPNPDPTVHLPEVKQICLDGETLALVIDGDCPFIAVMPLAGCSDDLLCQVPEWDLRKRPPAWWPCPR